MFQLKSNTLDDTYFLWSLLFDIMSEFDQNVDDTSLDYVVMCST